MGSGGRGKNNSKVIGHTSRLINCAISYVAGGVSFEGVPINKKELGACIMRVSCLLSVPFRCCTSPSPPMLREPTNSSANAALSGNRGAPGESSASYQLQWLAVAFLQPWGKVKQSEMVRLSE